MQTCLLPVSVFSHSASWVMLGGRIVQQPSKEEPAGLAQPIGNHRIRTVAIIGLSGSASVRWYTVTSLHILGGWWILRKNEVTTGRHRQLSFLVHDHAWGRRKAFTGPRNDTDVTHLVMYSFQFKGINSLPPPRSTLFMEMRHIPSHHVLWKQKPPCLSPFELEQCKLLRHILLQGWWCHIWAFGEQQDFTSHLKLPQKFIWKRVRDCPQKYPQRQIQHKKCPWRRLKVQ